MRQSSMVEARGKMKLPNLQPRYKRRGDIRNLSASQLYPQVTKGFQSVPVYKAITIPQMCLLLLILLFLPSKCWNHRHVPPCIASLQCYSFFTLCLDFLERQTTSWISPSFSISLSLSSSLRPSISSSFPFPSLPIWTQYKIIQMR